MRFLTTTCLLLSSITMMLVAQPVKPGVCVFGHKTPSVFHPCPDCGYSQQPCRWSKTAAKADELALPVTELFLSLTNLLPNAKITQYVDSRQLYTNGISDYKAGSDKEWQQRIREHFKKQGLTPSFERKNLVSQQYDDIYTLKEDRDGSLRQLEVQVSRISGQKELWIRVVQHFQVDTSSPR